MVGRRRRRGVRCGELYGRVSTASSTSSR